MILDFAGQRRRALEARAQLHEGLDRLGADRVGHADDGGHRHRHMAGQAVLDLAGADAVAGRGDDIVVAPDIVEIAVLVAIAAVAGQQPVAGKFGPRRLRIVPVLQEHHRVRPAHRDIAFHAVRQRVALVVDDADAVAGDGATHRPGAHLHDAGAVADHQVAFGLAIEFVDGQAEGLASPVQQLRAQRLAARPDGAQLAVARREGPRADLAHQLQGGGRHEGVAHLVPGHQAVGFLRVEFLRPPGQHRHAVMQRGQQHVDQPADPGPVGRRPEQIALLREELMREFHTRQMAQQGPVGMQCPLRRAGGARGEDDQRRVVGARRSGLEAVIGLGQQPMVILRPVAGAVDRHDQLEVRQPVANRSEFAEADGIADQRPHAGRLQPVFQSVRPEQREQRHCDHAALVDRDMGDGGLRCLGQQDTHPVARPDAARGQHIGQLVGLAFQVAEAVNPDLVVG